MPFRIINALALWLLVSVAHAGTRHYYYTDPQGTVLAKADASGAIVATYDYAPYGTAVASMSPAPNGPGYTGHVNDPDSGLVYMQARYYDPAVGRFLSVDPVTPAPGNTFNFNRYDYTNNNPINHTDPDGRNLTEALGGLFYETGSFVTGNGFHGSQIVGALKDGYNGEGGGVLNALGQDATTISVAAGGIGALKGVASLAIRQTGEEVVANLAKNAIKDDVKSTVRQIVKDGGEKQFRSDTASAMRGAKVKTVVTERGEVQVGTHSDGSTVSARSFSSSNRSTIQVNQPNTSITTKVRYDHDQ